MLDRIRAIAHEKKYSLNRLEHEADMAKGSIWRWEKMPKSIATLKRIAGILNVPVDELLVDDDSGEKQ